MLRFLFRRRTACKKTQRNETKHFPACFSKTGLKTTVSPVKERCPKLYKVEKRWKEMTKVGKR